MIYLDHAATTPVRPAALEAAWPFLTGTFGNPSSAHELGHQAHDALDDARARVASALGARAGNVVFTSGGTEGDNLGVIGLALGTPRGRHIVSAKTEHEAVLASIEFLERVHGFSTTWLAVADDGQIDSENLDSSLRDDTTLVTLMMVNNEIGAVHPVTDFARRAHAAGALFHTDAVQAVGWLPVDFGALGVDALTLSGHKVGAPKGSGATLVRSGIAVEPLLHGGGQEDDRRSGTENVAWSVALATALEALPDVDAEARRVREMTRGFIRQVLSCVPGAIVTGPDPDSVPGARSPNIASFIFPGRNGETILLELERRGIVASSGAACAAGRDEPSHVLLACGYDADVARTSVRFSFGHGSTTAEAEAAADALTDAVSAVDALRG